MRQPNLTAKRERSGKVGSLSEGRVCLKDASPGTLLVLTTKREMVGGVGDLLGGRLC